MPEALLRGVVEHPAHLLRVEAGRASGGRGGAEDAGNAVRAPVAFALQSRAAQRRHDARADVVAERYGAKEARAVDAELLAGRQRCGDHGGVRDASARRACASSVSSECASTPLARAASIAPHIWFEQTTVATFSPP